MTATITTAAAAVTITAAYLLSRRQSAVRPQCWCHSLPHVAATHPQAAAATAVQPEACGTRLAPTGSAANVLIESLR